MSAENKAASRRIMEEGFGKGHTAVVDEVVASSWANHFAGNPPGLSEGAAGLKQLMALYKAAFPDLVVKVDAQVAEGDTVVTRWTATGTNTGNMGPMPATGKKAVVTGINIDRYAGGKVVEGWGAFDQFGMMVQLGVIPM
jgi:predicted ester cyclase